MNSSIVGLAGFLIGLTWSQGLFAQGLQNDPTRPPTDLLPFLLRSLPGASTAPTQDPAISAPQAPRVQAVVVGKSKRFAMIDGVVVAEGSMLGQTRLEKVSPDGVSVTGEAGRQFFSITPGVQKTLVSNRKKQPEEKTFKTVPNRREP